MELLPIDGASISLIIDTNNRETLYASDEVVARIEAVQFSLGEGPCFETFTTHRPVLVADLQTATRRTWPVFAAEMIGEPVGAIFAFPLLAGAGSLGAMDMYSERAGWLSTVDVAIALQVVDIVTLALVEMQMNAWDVSRWTDVPTNRAQVHQATGMLIAELGVAPEHALARLRGHAFAAGRLVDDVADDLVARRLLPADLDQS